MYQAFTKAVRLFATVWLSCLSFSSSFAQNYAITDLGPGHAAAINNAGQVVGSSSYGSDAQAFLWDAKQGRIDLGTLGGTWSRATAINDHSQVVGYSHVVGSVRAFIWEPIKGMSDLGALDGHLASRAYGINNQGQIVGESRPHPLDLESEQAVLWDSGQIVALGSLGDRHNSAYAINDASQIVGTEAPSEIGNSEAYVWDQEKLRYLGALQERGSRAHAINNLGVIGGASFVVVPVGGIGEFLFHRPVLYTDGGVLELQWIPPSGYYYFGGVRGLNSKSVVVGDLGAVRFGTFDDLFFPAVWDAARGWRNLNDLIPAGSGWRLTDVSGINEAGQIVGSGFLNGVRHAFLLTLN